MSRIKQAWKLLTNKGYDENGERNLVTLINSFGFTKKSLKDTITNGYLLNTYVYSIIDRIASTGANIPIMIEKTKGNKTELVTEGDFYNFVHRPNTSYNYKDFVYQSLVYQLATGNVLQYGVKGIGGNVFIERWNLAPQYIYPTVVEKMTGVEAIKYEYQYGAKRYVLSIEEVMHLRKFQPDPSVQNAVMGLSPLQAAYRTLEASNLVNESDATLIKNRGMAGMLASEREKPLTKEERDQAQEAIKKRVGGADKYGSIGVTSGKFSFIQFAMSPSDLKILENSVLKLRDLCAVYNVSSKMFNDPSGSTYNNSKEDNKKFYTQGVIPPLENDLDHFNRFFVPSWNERDGVIYTVKLDTSKIEALQVDKKTEAEKDKIVMEGVKVILNMPMSSEAKKRMLIDEYGFSEEVATIIITPEGEKNQTLEVLRSISPLLATKLLDKIPEDEVKRILKL